MKEHEFREDLPAVTVCESCRALLTGIAWNVARFGPAEWFAIGIAKCEACALVRCAAAGSNDLAHTYARALRLKFMSSLNS